jgi:hypothetical protein
VLPGCPKSYTEVRGYLYDLTDFGTLEQDTEIADNTGCLGILFLAVIYFTCGCNSVCRKQLGGSNELKIWQGRTNSHQT